MQQQAAPPTRYADWKAPADDGEHLIWPDPAQILRDTTDNATRLNSADATRIQNVALPEIRRELRKSIGHPESADVSLIASGHQAELYHPGVWVKDVLANLAAQNLGGRAFHFAVDTDEPKHLLLRWPGGSAPLLERPTPASWAGALDTPSSQRIEQIVRMLEQASRQWGFEPMVGRFLAHLANESGKLAPALAGSLHALDRELGIAYEPYVFSGICSSEPYLVFAHHLLARAGAFADDYNAALDKYRREHKVRTPGRPMPNLDTTGDACEAPFWLDELATGARFRASVVRVGDRWALRPPSAADAVFIFDPGAHGWDAAKRLSDWLRQTQLRLSPRALTLTMLLRLLAADQFVHGIGGARYDQVTDRLIARHFGIDPPRFAVTTATLYFPGAAGRSRVCMTCVLQEGHRLRHNVIETREKRRLIDAIAAAPRRSTARFELFSQLHDKLEAAARHPDILDWERRREEAESREQEERVVFDRELFYAMQSRDRLARMLERYRGTFNG